MIKFSTILMLMVMFFFRQIIETPNVGSFHQANSSEHGLSAESSLRPSKAIPTFLLALFKPQAALERRSQTSSIWKRPISMQATSILATTRSGDEFEGGREVVREPIVRAVVSVDWEGDVLVRENLQAFKDFREAHPDVPLTHFHNAAYFTKTTGSFRKSGYREWIPSQAVSPIDENGLHLHGWQSLVESSGVEFRSGPTFLELEPLDEGVEDAGVDVDIRAYTVDELQAMIVKSKELLEESGVKVGTSFRAGGWLGGANVLEAIRREGFQVDSSAVNTAAIDGFAGKPLLPMLRQLWPGISNKSQPFLVETPAGSLLEMPNTGSLADFTTVDAMVDHFDDAVRELDSEDRFVHIGFHQESAERFAPLIIEAINEIKMQHGHRVAFETLGASAQHAMRTKSLQANIESDSSESANLEVSKQPAMRTKSLQANTESVFSVERISTPKGHRSTRTPRKIKTKKSKWGKPRRPVSKPKRSKSKKTWNQEAIDIVIANMGGPVAPQGDAKTLLHVRGLPEDAGELHVYKIFSPFGAIESVSLTSSGTRAFVKFRRAKEARSALRSLDGFVLPLGNALDVSAFDEYSTELMGDFVGKVVPTRVESTSLKF